MNNFNCFQTGTHHENLALEPAVAAFHRKYLDMQKESAWERTIMLAGCTKYRFVVILGNFILFEIKLKLNE